MINYSILQNVKPGDIRREPFPHVVVHPCLPPELYAALARHYPDDAVILDLEETAQRGPVRPNSRHDAAAHRILNNPDRFCREWLAFTAYHASQAFFEEVVALFGADIRSLYPGLEARFDRPLAGFTTAMRGAPNWISSHVALDCHIGINTPAARRSSVRRVHADAPDELFAALLYFRRDDDQTDGGDLEIFRWKPGRSRVFVGSEVDEGDAERVTTVDYRPNTLVMFVNSDQSLHAVSSRGPSSASRRLVNIMGRVSHSLPEGLFRKHQKLGLSALARRAVQRYKIATQRF